MSYPTDLVKLPGSWLVAGKSLGADLYLHLEQNNTILKVRTKGDMLSEVDLERLSKVSPENLLVSKQELDSFSKNVATNLKIQLEEATSINDPGVQSAARDLLSTLAAEPLPILQPSSAPPDPGELARKLLSSTTTLVEDVIKTLKNKSSTAYQNILQKWRSDGGIFVSHHRQVSALAALIQLSMGDTTDQEFSDLATAGLVHDFGLENLPKTLLDKHCSGREDFNASEMLLIMKHTDETLTLLKAKNIVMTPGAVRAISHHHENWDGSGYRGLKAGQIFRAGRILRVADTIVSRVTGSGCKCGLQALFASLAKEQGAGGGPLYDPTVISRVLADLSLQS